MTGEMPKTFIDVQNLFCNNCSSDGYCAYPCVVLAYVKTLPLEGVQRAWAKQDGEMELVAYYIRKYRRELKKNKGGKKNWTDCTSN